MREMTFDFIKKAGISELRAGFWTLTQSPLKVGFVSLHPIPQFLSLANAKRPENTAFFVHRRSPDALGWHGAETAILQSAPTARDQRCEIAQALSLRKRVRKCGQGRGEFATTAKKPFLQVAGFQQPCVLKPFHNLVRGFTHF